MADIVTSAEMASLQSDVQNWYDHLCNIIRVTKTDDILGGQSSASAVIATGVKCNLQPGVQTLRTTEVIGEQIESRQIYTILFPPGTDVKIHDKVLITSLTPNRELIVAAVLLGESWDVELSVVATMEGEPIV